MKHFKNEFRHQLSQTGFSLMEVLMGIGVFAIGMLALGSLQGALTRSTAEAKVRTTGVNIAEQIIEGQRGFAQVSTGSFSFADIVDVTSGLTFDSTMTRNPADPVGVEYTVTQDVKDYYYDLASDSFYSPEDPPYTAAPTGATTSDYKTVAVTVAWDDNRNYVINEDSQTTAGLGGGSVTVLATISNISTTASIKVNEATGGDLIAPDIVYTPGQNPDIVSLALGGTKFKESLTPEPKVFRDNLETRFDVVTYSQSGGNALFLRREEFVAVSCECTLQAASADNPGKRPAIWAGDEYLEPESVSKAYGVPISNIAQSPLCTACCRDHHDGGTNVTDPGSILYDPSRPADEYVSPGGDHKHYSKDVVDLSDPANLGVAVTGNSYVEACKLVRKDGFFRVAQDFRLEGESSFPGDYLITDAQVGDYSSYVTGQVYDGTITSEGYTGTSPYANAAINRGNGYHADASPPVVVPPARTPYPATTPAAGHLTLDYTTLPTLTGATFQQLRSRSIYIDYLSLDLREVIDCIEDAGGDETVAMECEHGDVKLDKTGSVNVLELIPFFELQTTFLNDWRKAHLEDVGFSVTNEPIKTNNAHTRGKAEKLTDGGDDVVRAIADRGVSGLTATDPINNRDYVFPPGAGEIPTGAGEIRVIVSAGNPESESGKIITGTLKSAIPGFKASNVTITASEAICSYVSALGEFTCFVPTGAASPKMIIGNFQKPPKKICIASSNQGELEVIKLALTGSETEDISLTNALPAPNDPPYVLTFNEGDLLCGGGFGG